MSPSKTKRGHGRWEVGQGHGVQAIQPPQPLDLRGYSKVQRGSAQGNQEPGCGLEEVLRLSVMGHNG